MSSGNGEKTWLVWIVRTFSVMALSWLAYTSYQNSIALAEVRGLLVSQGRDLDRLNAWRDSFQTRKP